MVEHTKKVFWHLHTLPQQSSLQNSLAGKKEQHTVAAAFTHERTITVTGIRL
jgi:hypothetical protein